MAQVIPAVAYYAVLFVTGNPLLATAAALVATYAVSSHKADEARKKARRAYNASLTDRGVMIRSGVAPRQMVVGRAKVSGPIVYVTSTGTKKEYLHLVVVLAAHEIDAVEKIYFNEIELPALDGSGFVTSGQFAKAGSDTPAIQTFTTSGTTLTLSATPAAVQTVVRDEGFDVKDEGVRLAAGTDYTVSGTTITLISPPAGSHRYTVNYTKSSSSNLVRIKIHRGQAGQVADSTLVSESGGEWTSNHVGEGIAYLYVRLQYDQDVFGSVGVPNISAVVRGAKVYDPRTATTGWTDNSALITAWWLRHSEIGLKQPTGSINNTELSAAANVCDELVDLDAVPNQQKRYTTNGTLSAEDSLRSNLEQLVIPMAGSATYVQGKWRIRAGAHESPDLFLDESDFAPGPIQVLPYSPRRELFNAVTGTYVDGASGYIERQFPIVENATYQTADGGEQLTRNVVFPMVTDAMRAQRLAKIAIERARQAESIIATFKIRAYDCKPNDVVALTDASLGWTNKLFVVRERIYKRNEADRVQLMLQATAAGVWDWNYGEATDVDLAPNTNLPAPGTPPAALTGITVATGSDHVVKLPDGTQVVRALVEWTASPDVWVQQGGHIEIQHKRDEATTWTDDPSVIGTGTSGYAQPIDLFRATLVRVRAVNVLGIAGPWVTVVLSTVDGDTALPTNVTGLTASAIAGAIRIKWDECPDIDYAVTEVRYGSSWATATRIFRGRANTYDWAWPADGSYTLRVRHEDRSGIQGNTTTLALTVDDGIRVGTPHIDDDAATDVLITTDTTVTSNGELATTSYTTDFDCKLVVTCRGTCETGSTPGSDGNPRIKWGPYVTDGGSNIWDARNTWRVQLRSGEDLAVPMFERAIFDVPAGLTVDISCSFAGDFAPDPNTFYTAGTSTLEVEVIKR